MKKIAIVLSAAAVLSSVPAFAGDVSMKVGFLFGLPVPVVKVSEPSHRVYVPEREYRHECGPRFVEARYRDDRGRHDRRWDDRRWDDRRGHGRGWYRD